MKLGALGDVHGDMASVQRIMQRHPDVQHWLSVGDLADPKGTYVSPPAALYWIKGNNDNLEFIAGLMAGSRVPIANLHYIPNGVAATIGSVVVAGLGGTFAPTWYERLSTEVPRPRLTPSGAEFPSPVRDDKRRHFLRADVDALRALDRIDVFLSHEAARPFYMDVRGRRQDVGKTPINEVLASVRPRLHLSGHHHLYQDDVRQGVRSIGLAPVGESYLLIDSETWSYERLES
jgi:Icc-related predicted phosphoesterase